MRYSLARTAVTSALAILLGSTAFCLVAGCVESVNKSTMDQILQLYGEDYVILRVLNKSGQQSQLDIRVDGELKALDLCTAVPGTCNYLITPTPETLELIESRRYDLDDNYLGGTRFTTVEGYTYEVGEDYNVGDTIYLDMTSDIPEVIKPAG